MKTMTLETEILTGLKHTRAGRENRCAVGPALAHIPRSWLKAPATTSVGRIAQINSQTNASSSVWLVHSQDMSLERILFALVAIVSLAAVAYGFASVLDLFSNWPVFNNWVGQIAG